MSLVETLVSAALMALIALSVLPLFTSSMASNRAGGESTVATGLARSSLEELNQLPFNSPSLTIPPGATSLSSGAFYDGSAWRAVASPNTAWQRIIRVRQFSVTDLTAALDGAADPSNVHLKEIEVTVLGTRESGNPLGPARRITLRQFKSQ